MREKRAAPHELWALGCQLGHDKELTKIVLLCHSELGHPEGESSGVRPDLTLFPLLIFQFDPEMGRAALDPMKSSISGAPTLDH